MKKLQSLIPVVVLVLLFQGCYYDKSDLVYPSAACDTTGVTYSQTIKPLVGNYCLACHGSNNYSSLGGNLNLDGYNNLSSAVKSGVLLKSIKHEAGASPMPKNSPQLSECHIAQIEKWISSGSQNN